MSSYAIREIKLQDVVKEVESGQLQLPEFQRDYVWKPNDQASLVDSIQKGYPVGALLLLEIDQGDANGGPFGLRKFEGAPDPTSKVKYLVLDGQQRITTTFRVFSGDVVGQRKVFCLDLQALFEKTGGAPGIQVDFLDLVQYVQKPLHLETLLMAKNLLPLSLLSQDRNSLRQKLNDFANNLRAKSEKQTLADFLSVKVHGYLDSFYDYKFPCVVLPASLDLEAVANVFTKLNTSGLRLSAFDLCVSKMFPQNVNLRSLWTATRDDSDVRLLDSDGTATLQTIAMLVGEPPKKSGLVKVLKPHHVTGSWDTAIGGLKYLAAELAKNGATNKETIPYDTIAPSIGAILAKIQAPTTPPGHAALSTKIERWIIQTAFNLRYTEGTETKKEIDFKAGLEWFEDGKFPEFLSASVAWQDKLSLSWGSTGARHNALLMLLNKRRPKDFISGQMLALNTVGVEPAQIHHIFPKAFLANEYHGEIGKRPSERTFNMTFLSAASNNHISGKAPSVYINTLKNQLLTGGLDDEQAETHLLELFKDHFIDAAALQCMRNDDYEGFLIARGKCVAETLRVMGIPVSVLDDIEDRVELDEDFELND
jgi:hypothetical protein